MWRGGASAATLALVAGCAAPAPAVPTPATAPRFDPLAFFQGRAGSEGTITEDFGTPERFTSATHGVPEAGGLLLIQHFTYPDHSEDRVWHLRRDGPDRITGTANDAVGTAHGEVDGSRFHWHWVLATQPGNWLRNVWLDQVMVLRPDGTVLNRATVSKLGLPVARVEETFRRTGP